MLSVVLYGRNDSHGYNLHKRAAISLNAIAELLTDADDEILFVDYNTPDDLPTFPEAIADTLTDKTLARLKIMRVRARTHRERFAARTHLVALEPIARNAAIRRANPANRWILSTNTDMIFCPREPGQTLTSIVGVLEDGFYHLPRFELPEGLWETLDRKDGPGVIAAAREWGERWHLNEITLADRDNLYDAPGDFQLFLRKDLYRIGGFHEEMILGWHLDANIAKRMRLLRGKVSSALERLIGYHCDHTRLASTYHKADRLENDQVRFGDQVKVPEIAEQMDNWGLPDVDIETFRLDQASAQRYRRALEAVVPARLEGFLETQYVLEDYGRLDYPREHVLPYLMDQVSCIPPDTRIAYVGARTDTFEAFAAGWKAMGGAPLIVLDDADWLAVDAAGAKAAPLGGWLKGDLFIFEIGAEAAVRHPDLTAEESRRLWVVDHAFKALIDNEGAAAKTPSPTRVIVVNGVHNFFEPQMMTEVAVTLTPYSSRIRHGYVADHGRSRVQEAKPDQFKAMQALQRLQPPTREEMARFGDLAARLATAGKDDPIWLEAGRAGAELEALVGIGLLDVGANVTEVVARVRAARPSNDYRVRDALDPAAGRDAKSRLARLEDWDEADFARTARRMFSNRNHALLSSRDIWTWERVALAQNLMAAVPPVGAPKVLVTGSAPELLAFALAHLGYDVDIADPAALTAGTLKSVDWRKDFNGRGWVSPRPVGLIEDRLAAIEGGLRYDAVLVPQNGLFINGRMGIGAALKTASGLLKAGGHLGLTTMTQPVPVDDRLTDHSLSHALTAGAAFGAALETWAGLALDGRADMRLTPRTIDRSATGGEVAELPALTAGAAPHVDVPAVWSLRRVGEATDWEALGAVMADGAYGLAHPSSAAPASSSLFTTEDLAKAPSGEGAPRIGSLMEVAAAEAGVTKTPMGLTIPSTFGAGVAAAAVLGRLGAGHYDLYMEIEVGPRRAEGPILAVAIVRGGQVLMEACVEPAEAGLCRINHALALGEASANGLSLLIKVWGMADISIPTLALR